MRLRITRGTNWRLVVIGLVGVLSAGVLIIRPWQEPQLSSAATVPRHESPWPQERGDRHNSGTSAHPGPTEEGVRWERVEVSFGPAFAASPVIDGDGNLYVAGGQLYKISPTGELLWKRHFSREDAVLAPALGPDGTVYVGTHGRYPTDFWPFGGQLDPRPIIPGLYAFSPEGDLKWKYVQKPGSLGLRYAEPLCSPAVGPDGMLYTIFAGDLVALTPEGKAHWKFPHKGAYLAWHPPVVSSGALYVALRHGVACVSLEGVKQWEITLPCEDLRSLALGADDTLYAVDCEEGLFAIDTQHRAIKWRFDEPGKLAAAPVVGQGRVCVAGSDEWGQEPQDRVIHNHNVYSLHESGELQWKVDLGGYVEASPVMDCHGVLYVPVSDCPPGKRWVYALAPDGSVLWRVCSRTDADGCYSSFRSLALGEDTTLYAVADVIYAIGEE